jgi:hypothetical protein
MYPQDADVKKCHEMVLKIAQVKFAYVSGYRIDKVQSPAQYYRIISLRRIFLEIISAYGNT